MSKGKEKKEKERKERKGKERKKKARKEGNEPMKLDGEGGRPKELFCPGVEKSSISLLKMIPVDERICEPHSRLICE